MSDDAGAAEKGLLEARTRADPAGSAAAAPELPGKAELGAAVAALAGAIAADDAGQMDLLSGSPDLEPVDMLGAIAETGAAQRRARGRPKGSANLRNTRVFDYLEALGHRDPAVTLSLIQSADPATLARTLEIKPALALAIIRQAAADLMPFKYAKKPQAVELNKRELHVFLAGSLGGAQQPADGGLFGSGQIVEYQGLGDGATVRHKHDESHDNRQAVENADEAGGETAD